jgi:glycosyltransferase involved in cell wall biosynthesis
MAKINIVIPVYNMEKYLDEFFESVLKQSFKDYLLFVVNDCSTDESKTIIDKWKQQFGDKLIYLENKENIKLGLTRNHGLEETEKYPSEYTAFLDSDDWIEPDYLESMYSKAKEYDADMVICGMRRFEDSTNKTVCIEAVSGPTDCIYDVENYDELAYMNPAAYNKLYKSECIKGYRFMPLKRSEDTCYLFDIIPNIKSIIYTNKVSYHYRLRDNSITGSIGHEVCVSMFDGFKALYQKYTQEEYLPYKEMFETQIFIRSAVGGVCRATFADFKAMKSNINETYVFMNKTMPDWKRNRYLIFGKKRSRTIKQFMLKGCALLYRLHMFWIFVYVYYFVSKVLKKDIRA